MTTDNGLQPRTIDDVERVARISTASGICRVTRPEEAAVILLTGRELGLSPMQSLRGIYVVNKTPVLSADLLVAVVRRSGLCGSWRVVESTPETCTITTLRVGETEPASRTWTIADARRAQITGKPIWSQYPAQMLRHRCAADLAREVYPDVVLGLYTPEEMDGVERPEAPREIAVVRAAAPVAAPSLAALGVEAPAATAPLAFATPGLSDAELAAMLAMLNACETLEALDATRAEIRPDVSTRATASQRATLRAAAEARRAALSPTEPTDPPAAKRRKASPSVDAAGDSAPTSRGDGPAALVAVPAWMGHADAMRAHLAGLGHGRAVEASVRKHGRHSRAYRDLAAQRVEALTPADADGARITLASCLAAVERWAAEGPRERRAA